MKHEDTYNCSHIRLRTRKLWGNMLQNELLHVVLYLGMAHDEWSKCSNHIECAKSLRRCSIPRSHPKSLLSRSGRRGRDIRSKNSVDEPKDGHEGALRPVTSQREEKRRSCYYGRGEVLILILVWATVRYCSRPGVNVHTD